MVGRLTIRSVQKVGFSVNHDNVSHPVIERIPERRVSKRSRLVGIDLRSLTGGR